MLVLLALLVPLALPVERVLLVPPVVVVVVAVVVVAVAAAAVAVAVAVAVVLLVCLFAQLQYVLNVRICVSLSPYQSKSLHLPALSVTLYTALKHDLGGPDVPGSVTQVRKTISENKKKADRHKPDCFPKLWENSLV